MLTVWTIFFCGLLRLNYDVLASQPRSYCVQQAFITLYTMLNTTFAQRLHCAHCDFTTTNRITLHANDAITASKQHSPRLKFAIVTHLLRINHAPHAPTAPSRIILYKHRLVSWPPVLIIMHSPNAINIK